MIAKFTILVIASALSIAMSAPNRGYGGAHGSYGGGQQVQHIPGQGQLGVAGQPNYNQQGGVYDDGQGQLGVGHPGGNYQQQGGVYDDGQGHGQHGQLGAHGHGQHGYGIHIKPGQQVDPSQQGGTYTEQGTLGGGYQQHGY